MDPTCPDSEALPALASSDALARPLVEHLPPEVVATLQQATDAGDGFATGMLRDLSNESLDSNDLQSLCGPAGEAVAAAAASALALGRLVGINVLDAVEELESELSSEADPKMAALRWLAVHAPGPAAAAAKALLSGTEK